MFAFPLGSAEISKGHFCPCQTEQAPNDQPLLDSVNTVLVPMGEAPSDSQTFAGGSSVLKMILEILVSVKPTHVPRETRDSPFRQHPRALLTPPFYVPDAAECA